MVRMLFSWQSYEIKDLNNVKIEMFCLNFFQGEWGWVKDCAMKIPELTILLIPSSQVYSNHLNKFNDREYGTWKVEYIFNGEYKLFFNNEVSLILWE